MPDSVVTSLPAVRLHRKTQKWATSEQKLSKKTGKAKKTHRNALYAILMKSPVVLPSACRKL